MDKRHHYFLILDCETATIPFVNEIDEEKKKQISVILPLVYDIGWKIIDSKGRTYCARSYIVSEIFSNPTLFNTAYYKDKRPLYIDSIAKGEAEISTWFSICNALRADLEKVEAIGAYNADFDFFRAIRFTNNYISKAYSNNFEKWYNSLKDYFVSPRPRKKTKANSLFAAFPFPFSIYGTWRVNIS